MKMHNQVLAIALLALSAAAGCGGKKAKPKAPDTTVEAPAKKEEQKPAEQLTNNDLVSPAVAVSSDIAAACKITTRAQPSDVNPNFDYDKDDLLPEDRAVLEKVATCLTSGPLKGRAVQLVGRADPRGTEEYNLGLGSKRASTVGQYLGRLGVPGPQLGQTTRGAIDATGTDEDSWKKDRRVDIVLTPQT
ncbi:MAG: OmpA family protein [Deltaproteobacteria bacterium]|nr:OmpA family protein [Deltaproteobacteria bacterium]MCW5801541.1 OmpA family protein [Deltaproteobacteria bacterium]